MMKGKWTMKNTRIVVLMSVLTGVVVGPSPAAEFMLGKLAVDVHGFVSQGYLQSDRNNFLAETEAGTFDFREYGLNLSSNLTEKLYVGAQAFGRSLGELGENKPVLDWAVADYRFKDWLGVRAGRLKIGLGLYNETRDIDMVRTGVFLPESLYNDAFRESFTAMNGVGLYGVLSFEALGSFSYQAQYGQIKIEPAGGLSKFLNNFIPMAISQVETSPVFLAGAEWVPAPPFDGLRLRWTWNTWDMDDTAATNASPFWQFQGVPPGLPLSYHADLSVTTLSVEYRWRDLVLAAEMFAPGGYKNQLKSPVLGTLLDDSPDKYGWYVSAAYRFTQWFELGLTYSDYSNNRHDRDGKIIEANLRYPRYAAWLKDATISARFDIGDHWVIKAEGHVMDGTDIMLMADNPDGEDEHWFLFAGKVTYSF